MLALSMRESRRQQKTGLLRLEFGRVTDNKTQQNSAIYRGNSQCGHIKETGRVYSTAVQAIRKTRFGNLCMQSDTISQI